MDLGYPLSDCTISANERSNLRRCMVGKEKNIPAYFHAWCHWGTTSGSFEVVAIVELEDGTVDAVCLDYFRFCVKEKEL